MGAHTPRAADAGLPARAGIGFKPQHLHALLDDPDPPAFVEVHAENYLGAGGAPHAWLDRVRERMPLSVHGVGLSLGGTAPPDRAHLDRLAALIARHRPAAFSEHLAWATHDGTFFNDLLPLRYDHDALARTCAHVDAVQSRLGMRLLLENPSRYVAFRDEPWDEPAFLAEIVRRTGCGLLLDLNNVHVGCANLGLDPHAYLDALPLRAVGELHLAGHSIDTLDDGTELRIDDHGSPVGELAWSLHARVIAECGALPTLVEWDTRVPDYAVLRAQAARAQHAMDGQQQARAA